MSSLGMSVVARVPDPDRVPFLKALAHLARVDDSVTLDEKQMVMEYAETWELDGSSEGKIRDMLRAGNNLSLDALLAEFSESGTRFLLLQELIRLSYADGTYADAERKEIARIAKRLGLTEKQFLEVEEWVERGQAWEPGQDTGPDATDLEERLEDEGENEHDLSDIPTGEADLSDIGTSEDGEEGSED